MDALAEHAADLAELARILGLKRSGAAYRGPCPVHGGTKSPFALARGAGGRVLVHCHAGCDAAAILSTLRRRLNLPAGRRAAVPVPRRDPVPDPAPRDWSGAAQLLWERGTPIAGTPVARYLAARGCGAVESAALRALAPGLFGPFPCMMAQVTDSVTARPITLHFTRLKPDGSGKAAVERPKLLLTGHRKSGGVVRLWPDDDVTLGLGLAEGIETALAAATRLAYAPLWATVDAGNLMRFPVLNGIEALTVFADRDAAGMAAAKACAARWRAAGRETRIVFPLTDGLDFADLDLTPDRPDNPEGARR